MKNDFKSANHMKYTYETTVFEYILLALKEKGTLFLERPNDVLDAPPSGRGWRD
ncbi:hypothetical protein EDD80_1246 [Anseongella ginsenosidimutans]|uniref:Uncharacterized protein n=1 Tax=Anseongella ginsenosidimutans TaxID=496056 RepID=A0A4V2UT35_9SPHI|nr:hypothetical protein EDD80_1246 [Anseongella ginsenosidimutans]